MEQVINDNFLVELYKGCLVSKSFLEIIRKHLQYHYIPNKFYKELYEKIIQQYDLLNEPPTIGSLSQYFSDSEEVLKILHQITATVVTNKHDIILSTFEKFIVNSRFREMYTQMAELHNKGKQEKAIELCFNETKALHSFTIKDSYYTTVYAGFNERHLERGKREINQFDFKVPFSIPPLDYYTKGGMNIGTSSLFMALSGKGKSTAMRWVAASAARLGYRVAHFQAEGTEQECLDAYDACWTSISLDDIEWGVVPKDKIKAIEETRKKILAQKGEVFVKASEQFDSMSLNDCNDIISDLERIHGKIHLAVFDYAELFTVKGKFFNSESGERRRREEVANKITNIATIHKLCSLTATQANDIKPEKVNNLDFYMTRSDLSEFKGLVKPFSNFVTFNQTDDEEQNGVMRLYNDKVRKAPRGQKYKIAQSLSNGRFVDNSRTLQMFWDEKNNKPR